MMRSDLKIRTTINSTARAPSAEAFESVLDSASPHGASNEGSCFKENININKSESPKLAMEPLPMKRKKKGGGYNLRKSLAWDRAFLTEEGVLDPQELSIISGASRQEGLPSIKEDTLGGSQHYMKPIDQQKLDNSIVKEPPGVDMGKYQKDCSAEKRDSSSCSFMRSTSLASHKVPIPVGGKSGSRYSDCPRPLSSSSLKRPANVNVGKAAGKELKLPKIPGLKPGFSPICGTAKRCILGANIMKHNQIAQPDFNIQENVGLKSSSKSLKDNHQVASKASSLQLVSNGDANLGNSSFRRHSSANVSPVLVDKVDNLHSKRISDYNITPARPVNSSEGLAEPTTSAAPLARNAHLSVRTMHCLQNQPMKPSGLRMPSPSLSFFSQPKRSVLPDFSLRDRATDVCGSQKPGNLNFQDNLRTTLKIDKKISESTIGTSKAIKLELNPIQKVQKHSKKSITERMLPEEAELQKVDSEVPSLSGAREQEMDDQFLKKVINNSPLKSESCRSELKLEQKCAIHESENDNKLDHRMHSSLRMQSDWQETCKPDSHELHTEKAELKCSPDKRTGNSKNVLKAKEKAASEQLVLSQHSCIEDEMESCRNVWLNTSDSMLLEKQACLQNSQQENDVEDLLVVVPVKKDGNELIKTKSPKSLSPGKMPDCSSSVKDNTITSIESDYVDNLRNTFKRDGKNMGNATSDASLSETTISLVDDGDLRSNLSNNVILNSLHQDTHRTEIDCCSSFLENRTHEMSPNNILGKVTEVRPIVEDGSASNWLTTSISSNGNQSHMDNLRNKRESRTLMVEIPESNMLNECCFKQSECSTFPNAENIAHSNDRLQIENHLQGDSISGENETYLDSLNEDSISAKESPLKHESSNDAFISDAQSPIPHAITYSSRVELFSDTSTTEVLDDVQVEPESATINKHEDGRNEKSRSFVLPRNAVPFSEEWLAVMEAAGEDILTKKSGAVQNSPPDKSVPEPSPWSPVKKKNNQIGPFDCTKFTNVHPSDSN